MSTSLKREEDSGGMNQLSPPAESYSPSRSANCLSLSRSGKSKCSGQEARVSLQTPKGL